MVTEWFLPLAETTVQSKGIESLPLVIVPHPFDTLPEEVVRRVAEEIFEQAVAAITSGEPGRNQ